MHRTVVAVVTGLKERGRIARIRDTDRDYDRQLISIGHFKHWETKVRGREIEFTKPVPETYDLPPEGAFLIVTVQWTRKMNVCLWGYPPRSG